MLGLNIKEEVRAVMLTRRMHCEIKFFVLFSFVKEGLKLYTTRSELISKVKCKETAAAVNEGYK